VRRIGRESRRRFATAALLGLLVIAFALFRLVVRSSQAEPKLTPAQDLSTPSSPGGHVLFEPIPDGIQVKLTEDDAYQILKEIHPGWFGQATSITPQLVSFTDLDRRTIIPAPNDDGETDGPLLLQKVPAWVFTLRDVCVPNYGPPVGTDAEPTAGYVLPSCASTELNAVIDANSGELIESFSYR
jgi:hypothetical protein